MQPTKTEGKNIEPACRRCGHCCGPYFALYVSECDEERWEAEGRTDLLDRLEWERERVRWDRDEPYNIETGETFSRCVFLTPTRAGHAVCQIHATKPKICRNYPPGSSELCALFPPKPKAKPPSVQSIIKCRIKSP